MATLIELRNVRLDKLNKLKALGIDPYPARSYKNHTNSQIVELFSELENQEVIVSGRIISIRDHKDLYFIDIKDSTAKTQLYIKKELLTSPSYKNSEIGANDLELLDLGDFIEAKGIVTKTKSGAVSVQPTTLRLLTKSLRPLPDMWDGLKDKEVRMRRRYLDTNINDDVYQRYVRRAKFWSAHREFFKQNNFLEINIPVLENIPGGADANPFVTHMDAIDQDFYLRISQELYLKRLVGGGYEKVFEVGPRFRNEGWSDEHLPEHMSMEFYWAYADWEKGMEFIKSLFDFILEKVYDGRKQFKIRGYDVDFSKGWEVIDFAEIMQKEFGLDIHNTNLDEVNAALKRHHVEGDFEKNLHRGIDNLWKELRKKIVGPAFLINHPKYLSPLAKAKVESPHITERFQPLIAGSELGNGWSEINDPQDQLARFREQQNLRDAGDAEAQWLDIDYVEMLEYGMPPTFGYGHSERVFWFLEDVTAREGVPFPQLKHEIDEVTRKIYDLPNTEVVKVKKETIPAKASIAAQASVKTSKGTKTLNIVEANKVLTENVDNLNLRRHCYAVGKTLAAFYDYYQTQGRHTGSLSREEWEIIGTLHDCDWEKTKDAPDQHTLMLLDWMNEYDTPEELLNVFKSHNNKTTNLREPETLLEWTLECCDELTGFIVSVTLVSPEKKVDEVTVERVLKKFKQKEFSRAVDREQISQCEQKVGIDLNTFIQITLDAMKKDSELLGL